MTRAAGTTRGIRALASAILVIALIGLAASPAFAQERERKRQGLFDFLFGGRIERRDEDARPRAPRQQTKTRRSKASAPAEPEQPAVDKLADAKVVLVIGDFLGGGLAEGLEAAFADKPAIRVVNRAKGSSGFVRNDVFDWPAGIGELIDAEKPATVVIMLGSNDRQQMKVGETREQKLTPAWTTEYEKRVAALAEAVRAKGVPQVWVGMPSFRISSMNADMLAFNDIYREAAEAAGGEFVDIWDGFVDANGAFAMTGPDITGQPVRLRGSDGINLTKAGKRKVAFYAEKPLNRLLGGALTPSTGPGIAGGPAVPLGPVAPDLSKIERTVPVSLSDPELDGGLELLGGPGEKKERDDPLPGERLAKEGVAPTARPGRADDFGGPTIRPAEPAAATAPADPDKTTSIRQ